MLADLEKYCRKMKRKFVSQNVINFERICLQGTEIDKILLQDLICIIFLFLLTVAETKEFNNIYF